MKWEILCIKLCNTTYHTIRKFTTVLFSVLLYSHGLSDNPVHRVSDTACLTDASQYLEYVTKVLVPLQPDGATSGLLRIIRSLSPDQIFIEFSQ